MTGLLTSQDSAKKHAFRRCYEKHGRRLYEKALYYTGNKDAALSIVRGVFTELYRRIAALSEAEFYEMMLDTMMEAQLWKLLTPIEEPMLRGEPFGIALPTPQNDAQPLLPLEDTFLLELLEDVSPTQPYVDALTQEELEAILTQNTVDDPYVIETVDYSYMPEAMDDSAAEIIISVPTAELYDNALTMGELERILALEGADNTLLLELLGADNHMGLPLQDDTTPHTPPTSAFEQEVEAPLSTLNTPLYNPPLRRSYVEPMPFISTPKQEVETPLSTLHPPLYSNPPAPAQEEPVQLPNERNGWRTFATIALCVFGVAALWFIVGMLMDMEVLPKLDLGYSWFPNFFRIFS